MHFINITLDAPRCEGQGHFVILHLRFEDVRDPTNQKFTNNIY